MADVRSLIKSYPEHKKADRIIEAVEEHGELDEHPLEDAPEAGQGDAGQADDDASSVADDDIMDQAEIPAVADHTEIPAVGGGHEHSCCAATKYVGGGSGHVREVSELDQHAERFSGSVEAMRGGWLLHAPRARDP